MAITLRSRREIDKIREAGKVVAEVLQSIYKESKAGISTLELDKIADAICKEKGAVPSSRGVTSPYASRPFPGASCISLNEQVVHGIPSEKVILSEGDMVSVDFVAKLNGYCADSTITFGIGNISPNKQRLIDTTKRVLDIAISMIAPGVRWSEVAGAMQKEAESCGYSVVRDLVGHGIGTEMHDEPQLPNYVSRELKKNDIFLKEGMILAVEPMINEGTYHVTTLNDGWTVVTRDGKCSAHFEHTIAVVRSGSEVLTSRDIYV